MRNSENETKGPKNSSNVFVVKKDSGIKNIIKF